MSPSLMDQGPSTSANQCQWTTEPDDEEAWMTNPHITGLAISASGISGHPNKIQYGEGTVCGKSFATIQEEITLGSLEKTHVPDENYVQRIRRRNASQDGMKTVSVVLGLGAGCRL